MTSTPSSATASCPKKKQHSKIFPAWLIFCGVVLAIILPVLPLKLFPSTLLSFLPDMSDIRQAFDDSKQWLIVATQRKLPVSTNTPLAKEAPRHLADFPALHIQILENAATSLEIEIAKKPLDPSLQNRLGLIYLNLGEAEQALKHFQKAVDLAHLKLAQLAISSDKLKAEKKITEASADLLEASKLEVELTAARSNLARLYEKLGERDKVLAELEQLHQEGSMSSSGLAGRLPRLAKGVHQGDEFPKDLAYAEKLMQSGQFPQAAVVFRKIIAADPTVALAHHQLGIIAIMTGNLSEAVEELQLAARLNPRVAAIENNLGLAYQAQGKILEATAAFEKAFSLDRRSAEIAINLGNVYCRQGRIKDAASIFQKAVQANPKSAKAHNNLAAILSYMGKYQEAMGEFEKALALNPAMSSAHYGLGLVFIKTRSYLQAIQEFKESLALNPYLVEAEAKIQEASRKASLANSEASFN